MPGQRRDLPRTQARLPGHGSRKIHWVESGAVVKECARIVASSSSTYSPPLVVVLQIPLGLDFPRERDEAHRHVLPAERLGGAQADVAGNDHVQATGVRVGEQRASVKE